MEICYTGKNKNINCYNRAKYIYQNIYNGKNNYLCGIHARRFKGSYNLRLIEKNDQETED